MELRTADIISEGTLAELKNEMMSSESLSTSERFLRLSFATFLCKCGECSRTKLVDMASYKIEMICTKMLLATKL